MREGTGAHGRVAGLLSERMLRTAAMVSPGRRVADVGCDHAYTSIYLVERGIAPQVVAMDVNKGPLARARENVERFGMTEQISLRLSDGLEALKPGEADTLLIAGMGGPLTERILSACPDVLETAKELVLQPQSEIAQVRRFIHRAGFRILSEDMLWEDGKFYVILKAEPGKEDEWTEEEYCYGRHLKNEAYPALLKFLDAERAKTEELLHSLETAGTEKANKRREKLKLCLKHNGDMRDKLLNKNKVGTAN